MPGRPLNLFGIHAARVVATVVGGEWAARDVEGAPEGTHDFDVEIPGGISLALEVTTAADPSIISQRHAAFANEWTNPRLTNNWWLAIRDSPARAQDLITRVVRTMSPLLEQFERVGLTTVQARGEGSAENTLAALPSDLQHARLAMSRLRVAAAYALGTPPSGRDATISISFRRGLAARSGDLNELVAERAREKVEKLLRSDADERHLFVWLDNSLAAAELAMARLPPPSPGPTLPAGVDVVWLATIGNGTRIAQLWQARPPGQWVVLAPPLEVAGGSGAT
jgi:hypothetical protein